MIYAMLAIGYKIYQLDFTIVKNKIIHNKQPCDILLFVLSSCGCWQMLSMGLFRKT